MIVSKTLPQDTLGINIYSSLYVVILIASNSLKVISNDDQLSSSDQFLNSNHLDLQIEKLNSSSVRLSTQLDLVLDGGIRHLIDSDVRVAYRLNQAESFPQLDPCFAHASYITPLANKNPKLHNQKSEEKCRGKVFRFGGYNDTIGTNYTHIEEYCLPKEVYLKKVGEIEMKSVIVTDLLPRQRYTFHLAIVHNLHGAFHSNEKAKAICMSDSVPLYPPQTDYGSFRVVLPPKELISQNNNYNNNNRQVDLRHASLYFRPVPDVITNHENLTYPILCHNHDKEKPVYNQTLNKTLIGKVELKLPVHSTYTCEIWSQNPLGRSANSSLITIPSQKYILNTRGKFNLYVSEAKGVYALKWTDMNELMKNDPEISEEVKTLVPNSTMSLTRAYTIYWCVMEPINKTCTNIEGMLKTGLTDLAIQIPSVSENMIFNRIFGISYRSNGNKLFTGIIWAGCLGSVKTEAHFMNNALKLHGSGNIDEKSILVSWTFDGCEGITALIKEYEINYCFLNTTDPCESTDHHAPAMKDFSNWSHESCLLNTLPNNLTFTTRVENLNSSTTYVVRMRFSTDSGSWNEWSEPVQASTKASAQAKKACQNSLPFMISLLVVTFISLIVVYLVTKKLSVHSLDLLHRYNQTNTMMPQRFEDVVSDCDNNSEMGLKYWINRIPVGAMCVNPNLESKNMYKFDARTNTITEINIDDNINVLENNDADQIHIMNEPDYVPTQMFSSQADQLSPTGCGGDGDDDGDDSLENVRTNGRESLSDTDDISVYSHSSFLANILNDKHCHSDEEQQSPESLDDLDS